MVRIRLRRVGAKRQPSYRVVAADKEAPRDGRYLEILGHYNPRTEPSTIFLKEDRVFHWLSVGAQPSNSVVSIFNQIGLYDRYQRFKDGEDLDALMEEADALYEERDIDPRTRREGLTSKPKQEQAVEEEPAEEEEEAAEEEAEEAEEVEEAEEAEEAEEQESEEEAEQAEEEQEQAEDSEEDEEESEDAE
jgi:small subunit ribosomal protein S16